MLSVVHLLALAPAVLADWSGNVNYNSPSKRHPSLGIHMPKVLKRQSSPSYMDAGRLNFTHGVASGDPYSDSVILWTRAAPTSDNDKSNVTVSGLAPLYNHDTEEYIETSSNPVCVEYVVSQNEDLSDSATNGKAYTSSDIDYTVKVEAKDLEPFTEYYYQFSICESDVKSPLGRTKTAPTADDDVTSLGLAVFSCSNFPTGFFNAYGNSARKDDVDFVVHVSLALTDTFHFNKFIDANQSISSVTTSTNTPLRQRPARSSLNVRSLRSTTTDVVLQPTAPISTSFSHTKSSPGSLSGMTMRSPTTVTAMALPA